MEGDLERWSVGKEVGGPKSEAPEPCRARCSNKHQEFSRTMQSQVQLYI